jgi:hypothetical protein
MGARLTAAGCALLLLSFPLSGSAKPTAAQKRSGETALVDALAACRAIADPKDRLACFDQASAKLVDAVERRELVVMDRQDIRKTRRSLFGFSLPRVPLFGGDGDDEEEAKEITATVDGSTPMPNGRWQIRLDTGALWQTTETSPYVSRPKKGDKIVITRGALGNYFLKIAGQRAIRGIRVG